MGATVILNVREGERGTRLLSYDAPARLTLGRGADCTVVLADPSEPPALSRHHCEIVVEPPRAWVRDLGSKNGTFVNRARLEAPTLRSAPGDTAGPERGVAVVSGDSIALGDVVIEVLVNLALSCPACNSTWVGTLRGPAPETPVQMCDGCSKTGAFRADGATPAAPRPLQRKLEAPAIPGYDVESELGRGGMGVVFLARRAGQPVALKVILPERAADERMRNLFMREVGLSEQLKHRHIVSILDAGQQDGALWMATEFCGGGTLEALQIQRGGRLPVDEAVDLVCQTLEGLAYAHEARFENLDVADGTASAKGLVHRDLKPQNLLLGGANNRVVKIADYGLAKAYALAGMSGRTSTGDVGGTPYFMSRWQAVNYKYAGPEVDVWAAAATLYYFLTGRPPRDFSNRSWMEAVLRSAPVGLAKRRADVPAPLAAVIDAALDDSGMPRYPTARRLHDALKAAL